jgi:hypothetical protein
MVMSGSALVVGVSGDVVFCGIEGIAVDQEEISDLVEFGLSHGALIGVRRTQKHAKNPLAALQAEVQIEEVVALRGGEAVNHDAFQPFLAQLVAGDGEDLRHERPKKPCLIR